MKRKRKLILSELFAIRYSARVRRKTARRLTIWFSKSETEKLRVFLECEFSVLLFHATMYIPICSESYAGEFDRNSTYRAYYFFPPINYIVRSQRISRRIAMCVCIIIDDDPMRVEPSSQPCHQPTSITVTFAEKHSSVGAKKSSRL